MFQPELLGNPGICVHFSAGDFHSGAFRECGRVLPKRSLAALCRGVVEEVPSPVAFMRLQVVYRRYGMVGVGRRSMGWDWSESSQPAHKKRKESGRQPLQIDGGGGQIGLNAHVRETAPDSARKTMPGLCLAMESFRPPTMPLIEPSILLAPSLTAASGSEQSGIVVADHDGFVHSPFRQTVAL